MKVRIVKKKVDEPIDEDLFSYVKPNSQRVKPITSKQKQELELSDKESRKRSRERAKRDDEIYLGTKNLHKSILEVVELEYSDLSPLDELIEKVVERELIEARKRKGEKVAKKVPQCGIGNPIHRADGTFGTKNTSGGSWSIRHADGPNCSSGQTKYDKGKRKFTKLKCGRKDRTNPNVKAKFKCKDGSLAEQEEDRTSADEWVRIKRSALDSLLKQEDLMAEPQIIDEDNDTIAQQCNAKGFHSIKQWLQHTNALKRAEDGELLDEPKQQKKK